MDGYLKRKHVETEDEPKRKGLFQEGNFPEYCYPIGEDLFVLASTYNKKSAIHIRRFNRYGDSYYPSEYGITLQPEQYNACFCHDPPTCIFGIADINMALEEIPPANPREKFYVLMNDEGKYLLVDEYTCRSDRVYKHETEISFKQWRELQKCRDSVTLGYINLKYRSVDFLNIFQESTHQQCPVVPKNSDINEAGPVMKDCLKIVLYKHIRLKKGLKPVDRSADFLDQVVCSVHDFNESCLDLHVENIALDFNNELSERRLFRQYLKDFLCEAFLREIKLDTLLTAAKNDFCK
ncbi:uncharacterized protein [Parasteatoda tepidariorum]|uniref:uncharacterized protein isoform X2 n=1 Tax=Parasteatoda tepidariorum TaxID=114398 RepID=UPI001C724039|nr:uncharacterized protein LOC122272172 [Parasteatoda tepidariorum]